MHVAGVFTRVFKPQRERAVTQCAPHDAELADRVGEAEDGAGTDALRKRCRRVTYVRYTDARQVGRLEKVPTQVKFLLPNPYQVCMHDTPNKPLFSRYSRAYSHGCIRIDKPLELAARLLETEGWAREEIDAELASGQTVSIGLAEPVPVIVTYLTAQVDESGTVFFYRDIYGRD